VNRRVVVRPLAAKSDPDEKAYTLYMRNASSHSAKPRNEKRTSSSKISKTDWARVRSMKEEDIILTEEHPELDLQHVVRVIKRHGLKPAPLKASVSLRIDRDVLDWFKAQGPGY
jgi:uncharacterized protein (DUF4415 family)